jgi:hypothetical protein
MRQLARSSTERRKMERIMTKTTCNTDADAPKNGIYELTAAEVALVAGGAANTDPPEPDCNLVCPPSTPQKEP